MSLDGIPVCTPHHDLVFGGIAPWPEGKPEFGLGLGVSTGEVAAALLGSAERLEYTLVGDTVNLSQRLQQLARPGETVATEATIRALRVPVRATGSARGGSRAARHRSPPTRSFPALARDRVRLAPLSARRGCEDTMNDDLPALATRGVRKTFEAENAPVRALRGVDLVIAENDFVALMGPSGCGKSTLLNLVAGLDRPDEGQIWVAGKEVTGRGEDDPARLRRRHIGLVFQSLRIRAGSARAAVSPGRAAIATASPSAMTAMIANCASGMS